MKILVVDDERSMCMTFERILFADEVTCVDSGEAAIEAAKHNQFDVVLMDISMPGMGGIEATRQMIEQELVTYPSRIWGMSAFSDEQYVDEALAAGARDFLFKPIRPKFLLARLKTVRESIDLYNKNQKQTKWWRAIFDLLPDPCVITKLDGTYTEVNQAFLDKIGRPIDKVLGQTPVSLGIVSAAERSKFIRTLSKTGTVCNHEIIYRYLDGSPFFGSISARIIQNGTDKILSITRDETERKVLQAKTQELGAKVRSYEQIAANLQEVAAINDEVIRLLREADGA